MTSWSAAGRPRPVRERSSRRACRVVANGRPVDDLQRLERPVTHGHAVVQRREARLVAAQVPVHPDPYRHGPTFPDARLRSGTRPNARPGTPVPGRAEAASGRHVAAGSRMPASTGAGGMRRGSAAGTLVALLGARADRLRRPAEPDPGRRSGARPSATRSASASTTPDADTRTGRPVRADDLHRAAHPGLAGDAGLRRRRPLRGPAGRASSRPTGSPRCGRSSAAPTWPSSTSRRRSPTEASSSRRSTTSARRPRPGHAAARPASTP